MTEVGVLLDLGNSQTRCGVVYEGETKYFICSNNYAVVPKGSTINPQYVNEGSVIFTFDGVLYAHGDIVSKEYMSEVVRPSALQTKVEQLPTKLSFNLVLIRALEYIAKLSNCSVESLDIGFNIKVLLPPSEEEEHGTSFCKMLRGITKVQQVIPRKFIKDVTILSVEVYPEGMAAFLGARFAEQDGVIISKNEKFAKGYVLIVDIGGGTTDCVIVKDNAMILDSKYTIKYGARNIFNMTRQAISSKYDCRLNDNDEALSIIEDCMLELGNQSIPIESIVTVCKDKFARALVKEIESYLESMSVPTKQIKGVLFVGGGSLPSVRDGKVVSKPVTDSIFKYMQELTAINGADSTLEVLDNNGVSPRELNLRGLEIIHRMKQQ